MRKWFAFSVAALGMSGAMVFGQDRVGNARAVEPAAPAQVQGQAVPAQQGVAGPAIQIDIAVDDVQMARAIAVMPGPGFGARTLGQADAVVVGRVVAIEPMDVEASPAPNQPKMKYRIAVIQVSEAIHGVKADTKMIRVGFIAQGNVGPDGVPGGINGGGGIGGVQILPAVQPAIQPVPFPGRRPFPGFNQMQLTVGMDGIFTLNKHHSENFYLAPAFNGFVNRQNNANFDNDVKTAKNLAKVMGNTAAALKSDNQDERFLAAAILISKYRMPNNPNGMPMKEVKIDAEESKLILNALAKGDWTIGRFNGPVPNSFELFNNLGVGPQDGYNPQNIRNQQDIIDAMKKFIADNSEKYVIKKLVVDPNAKGQPGVDVPIRPGIEPLPPIRRPPVRIQPGKVQILPAPVPVPAPPVQDLPVAPDAPVQNPPARVAPAAPAAPAGQANDLPLRRN